MSFRPENYQTNEPIPTIPKPYTINYPAIVAVADKQGTMVECIEFFDCIGGAMWAHTHYQKSPLVTSARIVGSTNRFILNVGDTDLNLEGSRFPAGISGAGVSDETITIRYRGLGGGGVGASVCRASAQGVLCAEYDESGGGRAAGSCLTLPRRERVLISVDDTDTQEEGATWTLVHNIATAVADADSVYLSHTIVQLYPVAFRTKNCVAVVAEFASTDPKKLIASFSRLLSRYTLSQNTGMASYVGFCPDELFSFGWNVKRGEVDPNEVFSLVVPGLCIHADGRGITGAVAAIPFYTKYNDALTLCEGNQADHNQG